MPYVKASRPHTQQPFTYARKHLWFIQVSRSSHRTARTWPWPYTSAASIFLPVWRRDLRTPSRPLLLLLLLLLLHTWFTSQPHEGRGRPGQTLHENIPSSVASLLSHWWWMSSTHARTARRPKRTPNGIGSAQFPNILTTRIGTNTSEENSRRTPESETQISGNAPFVFA